MFSGKMPGSSSNPVSEVAMRSENSVRRRNFPVALVVALFLTPVLGFGEGLQAQPVAEDGLRPMTFLDVQLMARAGSWSLSSDGKWMLYTVSTSDWEKATRQSDIHLVSVERGVPSSRQLTFTGEKNEDSPRWSRDGSFFVFTSNRDAAAGQNQSQLYLMRPDGGEARRITDARDGVSNFDFSKDGHWLVFRSGKSGEEQLYRLSVEGIAAGPAEAEQITEHPTGVRQWEIAPDSRRIYFTSPDTLDPDERLRTEKRFTVEIKNQETPLSSLWALELESLETVRLTNDSSYDVTNFTLSPDGRWVGFTGGSTERYERNVTQAGLYADLYLVETATGQVERLTDNHEVGEGGLTFSPDGRWVAFSAPDDMTRYTMTNNRVYIRAVGERGGPFRKIGDTFDGDVRVAFWSQDGNTIYFNAGMRVTTQLFALDVLQNTVRQLTNERAALSVTRDEDSGVVLVNYSDPKTPQTAFAVPGGLAQVGNRSRWVQLVDVTPEVRGFALGETEAVTWTSTDGKEVEGVLTRPVGYEPGKRYPLIVAIHGGPASADVLRFNGGYGAQIYAGAGYAVLMPNYRGSTNYGEAFKTDIVGDYFPQGYEDIMAGVDHLIAQGIVDGDRMGALGWSAGGHWSNWILTQTDRFKAISSGAGTSNWISMYAQSDVQRNRQYYLGNDVPYDNHDAYWEQSPLKHIRNARTPTMIHVVEGDPRVPSPQSVELHMALKVLGVDTELFMYPGRSHGIPDARNALVKSVSEMAWMDYYVRGMGEKFSWRQVLGTLEK
jgi:dipeptidyl aminopeptidase/acylaminoacyl peptidase